MSTPLARRVISAFIASPGDLADERKKAREVVEELNRSLGRAFNIFVDLIGWEDTLPGAGRPQELINRDVDACDLFLGLLWRRWGMSSGMYSSGFEEEFERARKRREETGSPEIWMAFKQIDADLLRDPGDQLRQVLAFREAQVAARELLYKEFTDAENWGRQLREWLTVYLSEIAKKSLQQPAESGAGVSAPSGDDGTVSHEGEQDADRLPLQVRKLGERLAVAFRQPNVGAYLTSVISLDRFETARLQLLTKALIAQRYTHDVLDVHDTNLLYPYRERVELVPPEPGVLFRTLVLDRADTCPGWYWFRDMPRRALVDSLFSQAVEASGGWARSRTFDLLKLAQLQPEGEGAEGQLGAALADSDEEVRAAALDYIAVVKVSGFREQVDAVAKDAVGRVAIAASRAASVLRDPADPTHQLLSLVREEALPTGEAVEDVQKNIQQVDVAALCDALETTRASLRRTAANELLRRGDLSEEQALRLLEDEERSIRAIGVRHLIQLGTRFTPTQITELLKPPEGRGGGLLQSLLIQTNDEAVDPDNVLAELFGTYSLEQLEPLVGWFSPHGQLAYREIGLRFFEQRGEQIRTDLEGRFDRLHAEGVAKIRKDLGGFANDIIDGYQKLDDYVRSRYAASALAALAANGTSEDARLARKVLGDKRLTKSGEAVPEAIAVLRRFGDASDVELLLNVASDGPVASRKPATEAALGLSPGVGGVAPRLLESQDVSTVRAALRSLRGEDADQVGEMVRDLLKSGSEGIRLASAALLAEIFEWAHGLEVLLNGYLEESTYFYNVVCWWDRVLYAPEPLRGAYRRLLTAQLEAS